MDIVLLILLLLLCSMGWLLWHIMSQQGRLLLRIEATEAQLAKGGLTLFEEQVESSVTGLAVGTQAPESPAGLKIGDVVPESPAGPKIGDVAPDFSLLDLDGNLIRLSDFRGHQTLVLFWNPSCDVCQELLPHLVDWEAQPPEERSKLLLVSTGSVVENQALGLHSPIVLEQADRRIGSSFGATGRPIAILVDDEGRITSELALEAPAILTLARTKPPEAEGRIALTIGMATYNDFDGVYFTLQALRLYQDLSETELLVIDNYGCQYTQDLVEGWLGARYIKATDVVGTAAPRDLVFREARGKAVLCCDSHVLFAPGVIARLKHFYREHPECQDLLQGPLVSDDGKHLMGTHFDPVWRGQMWGIWGVDPRGVDPGGEPFEIPMQGLGVFSCLKKAWLGFHPQFRGFGGEEGYIHEKFRLAGHQTLCLPWLRWMHRFGRPSGVKYPLYIEDKLRNYLFGHTELGLDLVPVLQHFSEFLPEDRVVAVAEHALGGRWTGSGFVCEEEAAHREREGPGSLRETEARAASAPAQRNGHAEGWQTSLVIGDAAKGFSLPDLSGKPVHLSDVREERGLKVSCICATYNRPPDHQWLLEEAIESFLRQDYAEKELIVLNDCPGQELVCDAPGVIIINLPRRFTSLGEKLNAGMALASGSLLTNWDDDDISLPWRLSTSIERLGEADYYNPGAYWFFDQHGLHSDRQMGVSQNCSLFRRSAFDAVDGYPHISANNDQIIHRRLGSSPDVKQATPSVLAVHDWFYLYRWGVSPMHLSGRPDNWSKQIAQMPVREGRYVLRPHWKEEYVQTTRSALGTSPSEG